MFKNIFIIFILFFCKNVFAQPVVDSRGGGGARERSRPGGVSTRISPQAQETARSQQTAPRPPPPPPPPSREEQVTVKRRREEKEKKEKRLRKKAGSSSQPIRYSYSGADCKAVAYFDDDSNYSDGASEIIPLEGLATISYSVYEAKSPVRRLGHRAVSGYTKGIRTIAGSMIFLVIEDHPLAGLVKSDRKTEMWSEDNDKKGISYKQINGENRYLSTMLKPFNIGLFYKTEVSFTDNSNEYEYSTAYKTGFDEMAHLVISGIEIISEGMVTSVNDMVTEITMQFVAHDVFNIEKQEEGKSVYETKAKSAETARKEKEVSTASSTDQEIIVSTDSEKSKGLTPEIEALMGERKPFLVPKKDPFKLSQRDQFIQDYLDEMRKGK